MTYWSPEYIIISSKVLIQFQKASFSLFSARTNESEKIHKKSILGVLTQILECEI